MTIDEIISILSPGVEDVIHGRICDGTFDDIVSGLSLTAGCSHGLKTHLEGDVARHTAMVVSNMVRFSADDPEIQFDQIDLLAALMHDVEKVTTRQEDEQGNVTFPGHEEKASYRVPEVARKLGLGDEQQRKLYFLVREHGYAHSLPRLEPEQQRGMVCSGYWRNLRLFQKADAVSCYLTPDGSAHLPVRWNLFDELRSRYV